MLMVCMAQSFFQVTLLYSLMRDMGLIGCSTVHFENLEFRARRSLRT